MTKGKRTTGVCSLLLLLGCFVTALLLLLLLSFKEMIKLDQKESHGNFVSPIILSYHITIAVSVTVALSKRLVLLMICLLLC